MGHALFIGANKQGVGYPGLLARVVDGRRGQVFFGWRGAVFPEKWGTAALRVRLIGLIWAGLALLRNGGFLRVMVDAVGEVRSGKSEGSGQDLGFLRFLASPRKLCRLSALDLGRIGEGGGDPLQPAPLHPIGVATVGAGSWETISDRGLNLDNLPLPDACKGGDGHKIPPVPTGSGVRAAQSAGLNSQSACRPKFSAEMGRGEGWSQSCALGLNKLRTLSGGAAGVN